MLYKKYEITDEVSWGGEGEYNETLVRTIVHAKNKRQALRRYLAKINESVECFNAMGAGVISESHEVIDIQKVI